MPFLKVYSNGRPLVACNEFIIIFKKLRSSGRPFMNSFVFCLHGRPNSHTVIQYCFLIRSSVSNGSPYSFRSVSISLFSWPSISVKLEKQNKNLKPINELTTKQDIWIVYLTKHMAPLAGHYSSNTFKVDASSAGSRPLTPLNLIWLKIMIPFSHKNLRSEIRKSVFFYLILDRARKTIK